MIQIRDLKSAHRERDVREDFWEDDVGAGAGDSALLAGTVHASYGCRGAAGDRSAGRRDDDP